MNDESYVEFENDFLCQTEVLMMIGALSPRLLLFLVIISLIIVLHCDQNVFPNVFLHLDGDLVLCGVLSSAKCPESRARLATPSTLVIVLTINNIIILLWKFYHVAVI